MASPPERRSISAIRCCGLISASEVIGIERMLSFQSRTLGPPGGARGGSLRPSVRRGLGEHLIQFLEHALDIAHDGHVGGAVLADFRRIDVDVDDLGVRREGGQPAGDAIVEAHAQGDEEIASVMPMLAA